MGSPVKITRTNGPARASRICQVTAYLQLPYDPATLCEHPVKIIPDGAVKTVQTPVSRMISILAVRLEVRGRVQCVYDDKIDVHRSRSQQQHNVYPCLSTWVSFAAPQIPSPISDLSILTFQIRPKSFYDLTHLVARHHEVHKGPLWRLAGRDSLHRAT